MVLAAEAWQLREEARRSIAAGQYGRALHLALEAQEALPTPSGESLRLLSGWLRHEAGPQPPQPTPVAPALVMQGLMRAASAFFSTLWRGGRGAA